MALRINPRADGRVRIPTSSGYEISVDALRCVPIDYLASATGLSVEELEDEIKAWAHGPGMPYHVLRSYVFELDSEITRE